jgi:hypothetical protein
MVIQSQLSQARGKVGRSKKCARRIRITPPVVMGARWSEGICFRFYVHKFTTLDGYLNRSSFKYDFVNWYIIDGATQGVAKKTGGPYETQEEAIAEARRLRDTYGAYISADF